MAIGFGSYFSGVAEGQQFREQQDLRQRDQVLREQESARRAQEADQIRQMRSMAMVSEQNKLDREKRLAALPTTRTYDAQDVDGPFLRQNFGKKPDGTFYSSEEIEALQAQSILDPEAARQALGPAASNFTFANAPDTGRLRATRNATPLSAIEMAEARARIIGEDSDYRSQVAAETLRKGGYEQDRNRIQQMFGSIMGRMDLTDEQKAAELSNALTANSTIPGNFRVFQDSDPANKGKFDIEVMDAQGNVRRMNKPRTLNEIYIETMQALSPETYERLSKLKPAIDQTQATTAAVTSNAAAATSNAASTARNAATNEYEAIQRAKYQDGLLSIERLKVEGKDGSSGTVTVPVWNRTLGKTEKITVKMSTKGGKESWVDAKTGETLSDAVVGAIKGNMSEETAIYQEFDAAKASARERLKKSEDPNSVTQYEQSVAQLEARRERALDKMRFRQIEGDTKEKTFDYQSNFVVDLLKEGRYGNGQGTGKDGKPDFTTNLMANGFPKNVVEEASRRMVAEYQDAAKPKPPAGAAAPAKPAQAIPTPAGSSGTNVPNPVGGKADKQTQARADIKARGVENRAGDILYRLQGATTPEARKAAEADAARFFSDPDRGLATKDTRQQIESELSNPTWKKPSAIPTAK